MINQEYGNKPLPEYLYQYRKFQAWNLGEYQAYQYILEHSEPFERLKTGLVSDLQNIRDRVSPEVVNDTTLDRPTNAPLSD